MLWQRNRDDPGHWVRRVLEISLPQGGQFAAACAVATANPDSAAEALAQAEFDRSNGRFHEALEAANRALLSSDERIRYDAMPVKHITLMSLGHFDEAVVISELILERTAKDHPPDSDQVQSDKYVYAMSLAASGRANEAASILKEVVLTQTRVFGRDHSTTQEFAGALADVERMVNT